MPFDQPFRIGIWRVHPRLNRIVGGERTVQIEPKMMQVLLRLADEPGQVVRREDLLDAVWPDTVVGDEVLSRAVSELRSVFGDDPRHPRVIETIRKSGYRLIAPVDFDPAPEVGISADGRYEAPIASRASRRRVGIAGLIVLMLAVTVAAYVIVNRPSAAPWVAFTTVPATTFRGAELHPALSPEGERLAFIWTGPDKRHLDLYVKTLASETPLKLTDGPFYEFSPSWSPDGAEIAFGRFGTGIFVISALGGPERQVVSVGATAQPQVAWSPTGAFIAYTDREAADRPYRLHLLSLAEGESRLLTSPPSTYEGDTAPAFSPDGERFAFVRTSSSASDVYVTELESVEPERLTFDAADVAGVTWSNDGRHVLFASNRAGRSAIWRIPRHGGEPELVASAPGSDLLHPSLRTNRLAYTQTTTDANIWRVRHGTEPAALLASTRIDTDPDYSADGERIAFVSSRSGTAELWVTDANTLEPIKLTSFGGTSVSHPRWSPDGSAIAFDAGAGGQSDVYIIRLEDQSLWRMTTDDAADVTPSWSVDGTSLFFRSNRSGSWEIWSVPIEGAVRFAGDGGDQNDRAAKVTNGGGFFAMQMPDRSLLFTRRGEAGLFRRAPDGAVHVVLESLNSADGSNWDVVGGRLYYVNRSEKSVDVRDLASGSTERYVDLPQLPAWGRPGLTVSPAGEVLYTQVDHSTFDIVVSDRR